MAHWGAVGVVITGIFYKLVWHTQLHLFKLLHDHMRKTLGGVVLADAA
jgi:hypothetical protein